MRSPPTAVSACPGASSSGAAPQRSRVYRSCCARPQGASGVLRRGSPRPSAARRARDRRREVRRRHRPRRSGSRGCGMDVRDGHRSAPPVGSPFARPIRDGCRPRRDHRRVRAEERASLCDQAPSLADPRASGRPRAPVHDVPMGERHRCSHPEQDDDRLQSAGHGSGSGVTGAARATRRGPQGRPESAPQAARAAPVSGPPTRRSMTAAVAARAVGRLA